MKVYIQGKKPVNLNPSDFKSGGEAKVWIKGNNVYKIYHDPKHMIPIEKIQELKSVNLPNVFTPKDIILNHRKKPIGFTMDKAIGEPFIKLYTTGYRNDKGIINKSIIELVENIKKTIQLIHEKNFLLVDINDLNIIVKPNWVEPGFIDVNSWKTPNFPATAINPNVRDYSSNKFTALTDWFSFGVITCYLFVGIHPFRGSHNDYNRSDIEGRMKDHVSIFNPSVRLPRSVRDFSLIPNHYRKWYVELFENGKRAEPPLLPGTVSIVSVDIRIIQSTNSFKITHIKKFDDPIISHRQIFGRDITKTKGALWIDKSKYHVSQGVDIIITDVDLNIVFVKVSDGTLKIMCPKNKEGICPEFNASNMMIINNSLFIIDHGDISEIGFTDMGDKIIGSVDSSWSIMPESHEVFDGVIYQLISGNPYLLIPIPKAGENTKYIEKKIEELYGYKVINAKHENGVIMLTGFKDTTYDLFILRFDEQYDSYQCRKIKDVDLQDPNFISLVNGIVVSILTDNTLEISRRDPTKSEVDKIDDPDINSTMKLCKRGTEVRFFQDRNLYEIKKK